MWASSRTCEVGENFGLRAGLREFVVGGERDVDVVADAARLDDEAHGQDFDDGAAQEGDHLTECSGGLGPSHDKIGQPFPGPDWNHGGGRGGMFRYDVV